MSSGGGAAGCRLPAASAGGSDAGGSAAAVGPRSGLGAAKARELDCDPAGKTLPRAPSWSRGPPPRLGWPFPAIRAAYLQTLVLFPFPPFLTFGPEPAVPAVRGETRSTRWNRLLYCF